MKDQRPRNCDRPADAVQRISEPTIDICACCPAKASSLMAAPIHAGMRIGRTNATAQPVTVSLPVKYRLVQISYPNFSRNSLKSSHFLHCSAVRSDLHRPIDAAGVALVPCVANNLCMLS